MKILILNWRDTTHPKAGGAELVTLEHARGWVKKGHQVTWLTSAYDKSKAHENIDGVRIIRRAGSLTIYLWGFVYVLICSKKYDVIIDEIHALPFLTPLVSRVPVVAFIHEVAGEIWKYMAPFPLNFVGRLLEKMYFPVYKNSIFWTDAKSTIFELMDMGIPQKNCHAIPCPISSRIPKVFENKEKNKTFIFVSRVVRMKGIEDVIKAFILILQTEKQAKLWIVGGGEESYKNTLVKMIRVYNLEKNVIFYGKVSENKKLELMGKAHLLLHASVKEGWGLVVLEAASQGTPSVVYGVPGLKDVVLHDKTGLVLEKNTPSDMAKAALDLCNNKKTYQKYQKIGKEWVQSLKWKDVVEQSEKLLLDNLVKSKK